MFKTAVSSLQSLPNAASTHTAAIVQLHTQQASMLVRLARYEPTIGVIKKVLALVERENGRWGNQPWWPQGIGKIHIHWGEALWRQGEIDDAAEALQRALQLGQEANLPLIQGLAYFQLGITQNYQGLNEPALTSLEKALAIWRQQDNVRQQGFTLNSIGVVAYQSEQFHKAQDALEEALTISQENEDRQGQSLAFNNLSLLATENRKFDAAHTYLQQSLKLARLSGDRHAEGLVYRNLGWNAKMAGELDDASRFLALALQLRQAIGDERGEQNVLTLLEEVKTLQKQKTATASTTAAVWNRAS
ncbi:MAG: tetratricopeptide repeat protein [Chloroflexota bacterium]